VGGLSTGHSEASICSTFVISPSAGIDSLAGTSLGTEGMLGAAAAGIAAP
jgi:hypothetical protein